MNSQTHIIMGAALFGKAMPRHAMAGALGGIIPDLPMYGIIAALRMSGYPLSEIFGRIYWEHWWQVANAIGHSFLLWGALLAISLALRNMPWRGAAIALSGSALLHSAIDFLCHRDDGHMHFWPLTEWRFRSPISYWDPNYFGREFSFFEAALGVVLVVVLWRRYTRWHVRLPLLAALAAYIAVPAYFIFGNA
ncbi:MAG: metal-dependent hydrolase [Phyllobacteriaceae bacterium]|nr:metal-dependent hydrolase [Phyllobacteriaceae bacterium]